MKSPFRGKFGRGRTIALGLLLATACLHFATAREAPTVLATQGNVFRPAVKKFSPELLSKLKLPPGFKAEVFAQDLKNPRMMVFAANGDLYVSRRAPQNDVILLRDSDGDGKAESPKVVASLPDVHGLAIQGDKIYLAAIRDLYVADIAKDGSLQNVKKLYDDLPDAGQHPNRTLAFSPQGELFLSVGSTCNAAPDPNPENATLLKVKTDGSGRNIFASGLRNTIGFDWSPQGGQLWGMDHGIDWLGDDAQQEELNLISEGRKYGWPYVFENGKANLARDPKEMTGLNWEQYAQTCENSVLGYTAHAAPMNLLFYRGTQFPPAYRDSAFVSFHGSWNRGTASGYSVMKLTFDKGKPVKFEEFLSGFFLGDEKSQFGRPCGLAQSKDGSLYVSDDSGGVIYRIRYQK